MNKKISIIKRITSLFPLVLLLVSPAFVFAQESTFSTELNKSKISTIKQTLYLEEAQSYLIGGLILLVTECKCSNNYLVTVRDSQSRSIKNVLVWPEYSYYSFFPGQYMMGRYTAGGYCVIDTTSGCQAVEADGYIGPGLSAGTTLPQIPPDSVLEQAIKGINDAAKSASDLFLVNIFGKEVSDSFTKAGINLTEKEINQIIKPDSQIYPEGQIKKETVLTEVKNYFLADEARFDGEKTASILDRQGNIIAGADYYFVNGLEKGTLRHEKTGILKNGKVFSYDTTINNIPRYFEIKNSVGVGKTGRPLKVFRSVAVNPNLISLGTYLEIPKTRGMLLPDGTKHNGFWIADDIGENLEDYEIDLFLGTQGNRVFLKAEGVGNQEKLRVNIFQ